MTTGSITSALTIEIIAAGLVTLAAAAVSGLGWLYRRIGRLEREMAQRTADDEAQHRIMASNDDVHELTVSIERLAGVVGRLEERLDSSQERDHALGRSIDGVRSTVARIDDYLMQRTLCAAKCHYLLKLGLSRTDARRDPVLGGLRAHDVAGAVLCHVVPNV